MDYGQILSGPLTITQTLFNFQDNAGKWPDEFNSKTFCTQDKKTKIWWNIKIEVSQIPSEDYDNELSNHMCKQEKEYVLVYNGGVLHSVYVDKYNPNKKIVTCQNSLGGRDTDFPKVRLNDVKNLYRVRCTAEPATANDGNNSSVLQFFPLFYLLTSGLNQDDLEKLGSLSIEVKRYDNSEAGKRQTAFKIQSEWAKWKSFHPSSSQVETASQLAFEGFLNCVKYINISDIDIENIKIENIGKLASIVTDGVNIDNVTRKDQLTAILSNVKCGKLSMTNVSLTKSETKMLFAQATKTVHDFHLTDVNMDIENLWGYAGKGRCKKIRVNTKTNEVANIEFMIARIKQWTFEVGWSVIQLNRDGKGITIQRQVTDVI